MIRIPSHPCRVRRHTFQSLFLATTVCAAGILAGCGGETVEITGEQVVTAPRPVHPGASPAERFGLDHSSADHSTADHSKSKPPAASLFAWDTPQGWEEIAPTTMRLANFRIGGASGAQCYLTVLSGKAGGVAANINRWRSQLSLPALGQGEVGALETIPMLGSDAVYVACRGTSSGGMTPGNSGEEATSKSTMLLGAIHGGGQAPFTIFAKMIGPPEIVSSHVQSFRAFCASLRLTEEPGSSPPAGGSGAHPDQGSGGVNPGALSWTAPAGWIERPARAMRSVTYAPSQESATECYVAVLGGGAGGVEANINRWRQQMGRSPLSSAEIGALPKIQVLAQSCPLVEIDGSYSGMGGEQQQDYMMLGVVCPLSSSSVFVKMIGPETEVRAARDEFVAFCRSLRG